MKTGELVAAKVIIYSGEPEEYFTFITPEAHNALLDWMDYRKSYGETINPESWLMRNLWKTTNTNWGARWGLATVPKQLQHDGVRSLLERALRDMGLRKPLPAGVKRHEFKAAHGMRKFYDTNAKAAKMLNNMVELTIGHSLGVAKNYDRFTEEQVLEEYLKAVPSLTINEDPQVLSKQLADLQQTNKDESQMIRAELEEKNHQIASMNEKLNEFELLYNRILKEKEIDDVRSHKFEVQMEDHFKHVREQTDSIKSLAKLVMSTISQTDDSDVRRKLTTQLREILIKSNRKFD